MHFTVTEHDNEWIDGTFKRAYPEIPREKVIELLDHWKFYFIRFRKERLLFEYLKQSGVNPDVAAIVAYNGFNQIKDHK